MNLPQAAELDIGRLSRIFDNKSDSYKLFWFQAVTDRVLEGCTEPSFEELIDNMIADAWYMVTEYHLNLGPSDTLEKAVKHLAKISGIKSSEKKDRVLKYIRECDDRELKSYKKTLALNVPYRLQAPFMDSMKGREWSRSAGNLIARINQEDSLIYYFAQYEQMNTRIRIRPEWADYIKVNGQIIKGWIELNMITYLQKRNPSVPGIVDKLRPPQERKLDKVKKYWKLLIETEEFHEIYGNNLLTSRDISIDHFVPWSYVAHDELWNLHPTTKSINSSKSNSLPEWDLYFEPLSSLEYASYRMMWQYPKIHSEFEKCAREHLNSQEVRGRLYGEGMDEPDFQNRLYEVISPVYKSAQSAGFATWSYER